MTMQVKITNNGPECYLAHVVFPGQTPTVLKKGESTEVYVYPGHEPTIKEEYLHE